MSADTNLGSLLLNLEHVRVSVLNLCNQVTTFGGGWGWVSPAGGLAGLCSTGFGLR